VQAWVFFRLISGIVSNGPAGAQTERLYDELIVAIYSHLYVGNTKRKIVVFTGGDHGEAGTQQHIQDELRATGCCELWRIAIRRMGVLHDCHQGGAIGWTSFEALRMLEFESIALAQYR
jgi:hypothetical protein